MALSSIVENI